MVQHQPDNSIGNFNYGWHFYKNTAWPLHFHRNLEAVYVLEGQVELTVAGKNYILSPGDWALVLSNQIHSYTKLNGHRLWITVFSEDFVPQYAAQVEGKQGDSPVFRCPAPVQQFLEQTLMAGEELPLLMKKACLYALCSSYLSSVTLMPRDFRTEDRLEQLLNYIAGHYAEKLTMEGLAKQFGYEYHYLSRLLNKTYHISFRDLLNQYRVDKARRLLLNTQMPVSQIAAQCGFSSIRSFNYVFRQMTGHTPKQERKGG